MPGIFIMYMSSRNTPLRPVESVLPLSASRAAPILRQILKGSPRWNTALRISDRGIIDIAAYGAHVFTCRGLECDLTHGYGLRGIIQIDDLFVFKVLISERRMGGKIHRRMVGDKLTYTIHCLSGGGEILKHHGELVFIEGLIV